MVHTLTVFADTPNEVNIKEYLNTVLRFGVAIFIFLAGFFFRQNADWSYIKSKLLKVLVPYTIVSIFASALLVYINNWNLSNVKEIIFSYLLGYKFGYYFIPVIIMMYFLGYLFVRTGLLKHINKLLVLATALQFGWLIFDEQIYQRFDLYNKHFLQFQANELIFYLMPLTWLFFFVLGLWYQKKESIEIVKKEKRTINLVLIFTIILLNLQIFMHFGDYTPHGSIIWSLLCTAIILFLVNLNYDGYILKFRRQIEYLSKESYSIFLLNFFFIYGVFEIEKRADVNFPYWAVLILFPVVFLLTIGVIEVVKRIFGSKSVWIIGG